MKESMLAAIKNYSASAKTIILINVIILVVGIAASFYFSQTIEKFFWEIRTRSVLEEVRSETNKNLTKKDIATWTTATSSAHIALFAEAVKNSTPLIMGLKMYDVNAMTIWSDLKSAPVGVKKAGGTTELDEAATMEQVVDPAEDSAKGETGNQNLLEVYTSIKAADGDIIGFVETYFDTTELNAFIFKVRSTIWISFAIILFIITILLRITFSKQNERIIAQAHELQDLFDYSPIGICLIDSKGILVSINKKMLNIFKEKDSSSVVKADIFSLKKICTLEVEDKVHQAMLGTSFETESYCPPAHTGEHGQWLHYHGTPIFGSDNKTVEQVLLMIEDVSEYKELEQKIKNHTKDLEAAVTKSTAELRMRVNDLEQFQRVTVDREIKMLELKQEIERLRIQLESAGITPETGPKPASSEDVTRVLSQ